MLAYAADRRPAAGAHPTTLAIILAGHAAALFAVMTARGDLPAITKFRPMTLIDIAPVEPPPPPPPSEPRPETRAETASKIERTDPIIPIETPTRVGPTDPGPSLPTSRNGTAIEPVPAPDPIPVPAPLLVAARSVTAASDLVPPYPDDMRRLGEEATIRLSLGIDTRGRVTSVAPVGSADPSFVTAARRHILRHWRYKPATEGGVPVASTQTVSIRFRLDG